MKRVGGQSYHDRDQAAHAHSQRPPSRHTGPRKLWSTQQGAVYLCIVMLLLLLYTWTGSSPTPLLHSFEFKIYEREFGRNASQGPRFGRNILKTGHPHGYDEPLGHPSWAVHQPSEPGSFMANLFYIIMEVGSNHKPFYVDIDTGSSLTWVHCRLKPDLMSPKHGPNGMYDAVNSNRILLCNDVVCKIADEYHDSANCDEADPDYCQYDLHYADNLATQGVLVKDSISLTMGPNVIDVQLAFGCGYYQTGCEYDAGPDKPPQLPSDGILGLSRKHASIPSQLHAKRFIRNVIGHCFLPFHRRSGTHVGILLLGESTMTTRGIQWAQMVERDHFKTIHSSYEGEMVLVKYGKRLVASYVDDHPERFVAFDSGTSMVWLTRGLFLALHDQISAEADKIGHEAIPNAALGNLAIGGTHCWKVKSSLKEVPFRHFKDITFGFTPDRSKWGTTCVPFTGSTAKFVMPPSNYLTISGNNADIVCLAIFADETYTYQTFGAYALKGLLFVVDNEANRIGWRKSDDCQ